MTSTPPAASERGLTVRIQGIPSSSASVNFTPGDSCRSSYRISRPGRGGRVVEPLGDLGTRASRSAPIETRWAAYGATSSGQTMPLSSWWASTMQATFRPRPIPYEPMTIGWAAPSSPR